MLFPSWRPVSIYKYPILWTSVKCSLAALSFVCRCEFSSVHDFCVLCVLQTDGKFDTIVDTATSIVWFTFRGIFNWVQRCLPSCALTAKNISKVCQWYSYHVKNCDDNLDNIVKNEWLFPPISGYLVESLSKITNRHNQRMVDYPVSRWMRETQVFWIFDCEKEYIYTVQ